MWNECEHRVELVASGDTAEVDNFGGEGTGLKTMLEVDWRLGETITLVVNGIQVELSTNLRAFRSAQSSVRRTVAVTLSHSGQPLRIGWSVGSFRELCQPNHLLEKR